MATRESFAIAVLALLPAVMLAGCLGGEVSVDEATVINAKSGGSLLGDTCEVTVRMEDGSSKVFTIPLCPEEGDHVCVSKSATPAIISGCSWT